MTPEVAALKAKIFDTLDTIKRQGEVMSRRNGDTRPAETVVEECSSLEKLLRFLYEEE